MNRLKTLIFCLFGLILINCSDDDAGDQPSVITEAPELKGKLVYHHYTSYESMDSEMYLYDFESGELKELSGSWNIQNPMNAHFSPDGKYIVFMGIGAETGTWDIFRYELAGTGEPENLTPDGRTRDEDPKFSPDGKRIAFKQDSKVAEMDLETREVSLISASDYSMPYYHADGTRLVCSKGSGSSSSIVVIDIKSKAVSTLYDTPNVQDYYPVNADETSFYYSSGYSENNRIDQVYRGYWSGLKSKRLPFNDTKGDYSDAYPVNGDWVIISSTRSGGRGGYDLYIANVESGEVFPMTGYHEGINTSKNELGASVFIRN
jgi:Tol biopolymer transport system component